MLFALLLTFVALASTPWQQPPQEILDVLHAEVLPSTRVSPTGTHVLMSTSVRYPPLEDRAVGMLALAGMRVDARNNDYFGRQGSTSPQILRVDDGSVVDVSLPDGVRVAGSFWSADGERLVLLLRYADHIGLWVGGPDGSGTVVEGLAINRLLGSGGAQFLPDQRRLLVRRVVADRGAPPQGPVIPVGPMVRSGDGDTATSTYEARNLLTSAHDEALFEYYTTSQVVIVDVDLGTVEPLGEPGMYADVSASPNGKFLLVERLTPPWSHRHAWWRFGHDVEVWKADGTLLRTVASLPLADAVPIHGVAEGPRMVGWRATAPATLVWTEALDGGDWSNEVDHRDRLLTLKAPFKASPTEVFRAQHRIRGWQWGERKDTLLVEQYERARRWRHVWVVDVDMRNARPVFDLSTKDRYNDPGRAMMRPLPNGKWVLRRVGDGVYFSGSGSSDTGDRPFVDKRSLVTGEVERVFRSDPDRYETFASFVDAKAGDFLFRSQSPSDPPNLYRAVIGERVDAADGEAVYAREQVKPVTAFEDPAPQLRDIERQIVTYEREDGVPLSFMLYTPPGYEPGTPLPTVVYAYPREFSDPTTAGQIGGSDKTFFGIGGPSHLFFLLQGYAVLHRTRMPVIGDPDTAYDTFVEQLVSGAEAAVAKAVEMGVTDPDRVGVMGHSHGGLMTVTLLAHSDAFKAGIARSGAYNHTIRPFGFQSERRTLWQAMDTYVHLSPVMHAPKINEPLLLIHGELDENPGTVSLQSERLFEAVRGTGGTVRLLMLPYEGHGYRAKESVEHTLWEQLSWFDEHVKGAE